MADSCCSPPPLNLENRDKNAGYRRMLWAVLGINASMFLVEVAAGLPPAPRLCRLMRSIF